MAIEEVRIQDVRCNYFKTEKENNCRIVNRMSICTDPQDSCLYFKQGYMDCFFFIDGRCCNSRTIEKVSKR